MTGDNKHKDNKEIEKIADIVRSIAEGNNYTEEEDIIKTVQIMQQLYFYSDQDC